LHLIAGIAWDPQIRGFLAVAVGVVVLMGSVYLVLATNLGARLGFLIAMTAVFGWITLMGTTWWVYGTIGMLGDLPTWHVAEVVYDSPPVSAGLPDADLELARDLDTSALPPAEDLNALDEAGVQAAAKDAAPTLDPWRLLPESDPSFGEAKAAVDEYFVANPDETLGLKTASDYIATYSFETGGKDPLPDNPSRLDRITHKLKTTFWQVKNPPHYAVVQVQPALKQTPVAGEAPPAPKPDPSKPEVSVIMERDLGQRRMPGAMLAIFSGIMFGVTVSMLHRRDLRAAEARGLVPAPTEG
jgi:hypothetical protein